mmetsp:Transcript_6144/g.9266  ORF Transcript_6144/g.9266 Transcript_6144/m.9266 type:complete len:555 (+) Transcript_6144:54-1718(+)
MNQYRSKSLSNSSEGIGSDALSFSSLASSVGVAHSSRYSVPWSPNSIPHCEICLKLFTIRRRRHHCRKCGCIVCYKCSGHSIVIPRLGKGQQRVCDSCYNNVYDDPCSNLVEDCIESGLQQKMMRNVLHVGVITSSAVIAQSIVQGLSIAMTGSPLGKEVDVECFPSPYTPPAPPGSPPRNSSLSLPNGMLSRHSISPSILSVSSLTLSNSHNYSYSAMSRPTLHSLPEEAPSTPTDPCTRQATAPLASRYVRSDTESKQTACDKARLAYDMYCEKYSRGPDFSVGIVFGVMEDRKQTCRDSSMDSNIPPLSAAVHQGVKEPCAEHSEQNVDKSVDKSPTIKPAENSGKTDSNGDMSCLTGDESPTNHCRNLTSLPFEVASHTPGAEAKEYQIFYWVAMYDGSRMSTSRSASVSLPPSLCAHIHRRDREHSHQCKIRQEKAQTSTNTTPEEILHHGMCNFEDVDIEEELVAAILRAGHAAASGLSPSLTPLGPSPGNRSEGGPQNPFSISNALSGGIIGWLTGGRMTRASYLQSVVQLAYIPFQWKDLYEVTDV